MITTYAELKTAISEWLDRDNLDDQIDTFIDFAESRHKREIRIREMLSRSNLAIADGDRYVDLPPTDFLDIKYLRILIPNAVSSRRYFPDLNQLSIHELTACSVNDLRRPFSYSVHTQIEFDSEADQAYTGELFYYQDPGALTDSNTTNVILEKAPDMYLYAALSASAPFLLDDERISVWEGLYTSGRDALNLSEIQNRHAGPLISRVQNVR